MAAIDAPAPAGADAATQSESPYVGPRPFERVDSGVFFGRDDEVRELLSLVVAHRVVLLYAASGAGKTSLLSAGLVPALEGEEDFDVLPIARVRGLTDDDATGNVFAAGLLSHWGMAGADTTIADVLRARERPLVDGFPAPRALIVDQFEELFTVHQERWRERTAFVEQLAEALDDDPLLRLVIAIREDYVAQLDPYAPILGGLRTRFRLELLRPGAALAAVVGPLEGTGRSFAPGTAERLIRDLLRIRVETGAGKPVEVEGEFVEPVQLQVACHSLWSALPPDVDVITDEHLETFGDVDEVLASYYADAIAAAARAGGMRESRLRDRVEQVFITPLGTRGTAYGTQEQTAGIPAAAIAELERRHLVRAERVRGARWYELTHDRLIEPIQTSNRQARQERQRRRIRRGAVLLLLALVAAVAALAAQRESADDAAPAGPGPSERRLRAELEQVELVQESLVAILRHDGPVDDARFSSDGGYLITASADGTARVWDAKTGQQALLLPGDGPVTSASFDPAGRRIVMTARNGTVRLWNWTRLRRLAASPDATRELQQQLGVAADGILGPRTMRALRRQVSSRFRPGDGNTAADAAFSSDSKLVASAHRDGVARVWTVGGDGWVNTPRRGAPVLSVAFHPRRSFLLGASAGRIDEWDVRRKGSRLDPVRTLTDEHVREARFGGADGQLIITADADGRARIWRDTTLLVELESDGRTPALSAALSADGTLAAVGFADGSARLWQVDLGNGAASVREGPTLGGHKGAVTATTFSPDGDLVVTASRDGTARGWSLEQLGSATVRG
jgi:WD40 repeat protein